MTVAKLLDGIEVGLEGLLVALEVGLGESDPALAVVFHVVQFAATEEACRCELGCAQHLERFDLVAARFKERERFFILRRLGEKI